MPARPIAPTARRSGSPVERRDALYARYSSHAQDESTSIALQVEAFERAAGAPLLRFIDQAKTGRSTGGRTELLNLIREAEAGRIGRLYVYKFDRLGRAAETHVLVEDLEELGVEVVSVTEGANTLARGVQLVVAAEYSRALAERTRAGLVQRHQAGRWTGGMAPYGYQVIDADGGRRLAIQEEEAEAVRFVFDTYLHDSVGLKEIARRLRARGVPSRLGAPWGHESVRSIIRNPMVVGRVVYGRRQFRLDRTTGRRVPRWNDAAQHRTQLDETLRIVSDRDFDRAAQRLLDSARAKPVGVRTLRPFTRLVYCASCGGPCYARKSARRGHVYYYYGCGARQSRGCDVCSNAATIREDRLLAKVHSSITSLFDDLDALFSRVLKIAQATLSAVHADGAQLRTRAAELDREIGKLIRVLADPDIDQVAKRAVSRELSALEVQRDELRGSLNRLAESAAGDAEDLASACREAIERARVDCGRVGTTAQLNRYIAEKFGAFELRPDGSVVQKEQCPHRDGAGTRNSGGSISRAPAELETARFIVENSFRTAFWQRFAAAMAA